MLWFALVACIIILSVGQSPKAEDLPFEYHHHLHNFDTSTGYLHAIEMDYFLVASRKPSDPKYDTLGLIKNINAKAGPIRVYKEKSTGKIYVMYQAWFERANDNLNSFAYLYGIERVNGRKYLLAQRDLDIIKGCSAAIKYVGDLTLANVTAEILQDRFSIVWPTEDSTWLSFTLRGNWQSKKVVNDAVQALTVTCPWYKYRVIFFDAIGDNLSTQSVNKNYGGLGYYSTWNEGKLELLKRVTEYARNTKLTGQAQPHGVFANIYDFKRNWAWDYILRWYAEDMLRLDHYYYEKGGLGTQAPNGVMPGTTIPAYVDPDNPNGAWLPASIVSLDDVYGYYNKSTYDRTQHFNQHLDACGTAGIHGAWFGWYGEDTVDLSKNGQLIYTNDLQLLRAIPNWDNLAGIPVPAYNRTRSEDQRHWDGMVYWSINSYASDDVIYSLNPLNNELFIVFKTLYGVVNLPEDVVVTGGYFVDQWFAKTGVDALPALEISGNQIRLRAGYQGRLNTGIRLTFPADQITRPVAVDDSASTDRDIATTVDVLANDRDPNGDTLTITEVQSPTDQSGTASINGNRTPANPNDDFINYTPPVGFSGTDTFTYTIDDGNGGTDTATVTVTVNKVTSDCEPYGEPNYDPAAEDGIFLWKEGNVWHLRAVAGFSGWLRYTGSIVSDMPLVSITPVGLEASDILNTSNPREIIFDISMWGPWFDGFDFEFPSDATVSFDVQTTGGDATGLVFIGKDRCPIDQLPYQYPLDITGPDCEPYGEPTYDPAVEDGIFLWKEGNVWHLRAVAGLSGSVRYTGTIVSDLPLISISPISLERDDILDTSNPREIIFDISMFRPWLDGIDFQFPNDATVSFDVQMADGDATDLVFIGGDRCTIDQLPLDISGL